MDDATLGQLEHENMLDWLRVTVRQVPDGVLHEASGVGTYLTGAPARLFNQIVPIDDSATDGAVADAVDRARRRGDRFCVVLRDRIDDRLRNGLLDLGLTAGGSSLPGMALDPIPGTGPPPPDGLDIGLIHDDAGLDEHALVASAAFGVPEPVGRLVTGRRLWERPGCAVYLGSADGRPVTTGFTVRTGRTIGLYAIATLAEARGRGFGTAMTWRAIADGRAAGCDVAVLQASTMGRPIYERLGFRLVTERTAFVDPSG